jgi:tryptophan synthase alpha chain
LIALTQAAKVAVFAHGVIVGEGLVRCLTEAGSGADGLTAVRELSAEPAAGLRQGR